MVGSHAAEGARLTRDGILEAIRRIAAENGGQPPGRRTFEHHTGVRQSHWLGRYWSRWGDALEEAGLEPNRLQTRVHSDEQLVGFLADAVRDLGHFPTYAELRIRTREPGAPSHNTFERLGGRRERVALVRQLAETDPNFADLRGLLPPAEQPDRVVAPQSQAPSDAGVVYLARSGRFHKIGQTRHIGRRSYELALQLPERIELVHTIRTDDPVGVERYWHDRFAHLRANGEWFKLGRSEVAAFKRWPDLA